MRTTVEIPDPLRARLLELAARRGEKGFSRIVEEALDRYLAHLDAEERDSRVASALAALGSLDDAAAEALRSARNETRRRWR